MRRLSEKNHSTDERFRIEAASYPIAIIATHNFWILRGPEGEVIAELHGLSTNRKTERIVPIGTIGYRLGFYQLSVANLDIPATGSALVKKSQRFKTMFQGNRDEVKYRWMQAVDQLASLNAKDINYSCFGIFGFPLINSNSAYRKLADLMGIASYRFPGLWEPGSNGRIE